MYVSFVTHSIYLVGTGFALSSPPPFYSWLQTRDLAPELSYNGVPGGTGTLEKAQKKRLSAETQPIGN